MAYATNEQFSSENGPGSGLRVIADENGGIQVKSLAAGSGTLAPLTALAFNTSTNSWQVFDADGSNGTDEIKGFLWPDEVTLDGSDEVMAQVLMAGQVHYDDIPLVSGSYNQSELAAALKSAARPLGLRIQGLAEVR